MDEFSGAFGISQHRGSPNGIDSPLKGTPPPPPPPPNFSETPFWEGSRYFHKASAPRSREPLLRPPMPVKPRSRTPPILK